MNDLCECPIRAAIASVKEIKSSANIKIEDGNPFHVGFTQSPDKPYTLADSQSSHVYSIEKDESKDLCVTALTDTPEE